MNSLLARLYFLLLAVLAFFELLLSNAYALFFNLAPTAKAFGLTGDSTVLRLAILILLDASILVGAVASYQAVARKDSELLKKATLFLLVAMLAYGAYQLLSAWMLLLPQYKLAVSTAGVVYAILGFLAFVIGGRSIGPVAPPRL